MFKKISLGTQFFIFFKLWLIGKQYYEIVNKFWLVNYEIETAPTYKKLQSEPGRLHIIPLVTPPARRVNWRSLRMNGSPLAPLVKYDWRFSAKRSYSADVKTGRTRRMYPGSQANCFCANCSGVSSNSESVSLEIQNEYRLFIFLFEMDVYISTL